MSDLIDLASPRVRIVPVVGDGMEPTLRPRDFALCRPVQGYQGEGIYLLSDLVGGETFYRVDSGAARGRVRLLLDNPYYQGGEVDRADFEQRVQAIVVADIRTRVPVERWERLR